MRNFKVEYQSGIPSPSFEGGDAEAWVLEAFLREATSFMSQMLAAVTDAQAIPSRPVDFGGNEISFEADAETIAITAEWIRDDAGNECVARIPTEEAKRLLLTWQDVLSGQRPHPHP